MKSKTKKTKVQYRPYLYGAYGMNTSLASMRSRCPAAVPKGTLLLHDYAMVFRGVADIVSRKRASVHLALWELTPACEKSLDMLEGYRADGKGLYDKIYKRIRSGTHRGRLLMIYKMRARDLAEPSEFYEATLREGYQDFGMPAKQIDVAIAEAVAAQDSRGQRVIAYAGKNYDDADRWYDDNVAAVSTPKYKREHARTVSKLEFDQTCPASDDICQE